MIDTQEGRTSVWEYVNPVAITKFAYFNPIGSAMYGPWRALAVGRGLSIPGISPVGGVRVAEFAASAGNLIKGEGAFVAKLSDLGRLGRKSLWGGIRHIGSGERAAATEALAYATGGTNSWRTRLLHNTLQARKAGKISQETAMMSLGIKSEVANITAKNLAVKPGGVVMARAGLIWAGRIVNPVMNILAAVQVAKFLGETTFKTIRATSEAINRATEHVYNLELGGELTRGFLTGTAATERQRALQAIQASHLSGRSALGNEAQLAHS